MKKLMIVLVCVCALVAASCKKSKSTTADPHYASGMHATVNSVEVQVGSVNNTIIGVTGSLFMNLEVSDTAGNTISFTVNSVGGTGTYNVGGSNQDAASFYESANQSVHNATSGKVRVEYMNDSVIEGSFNFITDTFAVNGTYNVTY